MPKYEVKMDREEVVRELQFCTITLEAATAKEARQKAQYLLREDSERSETEGAPPAFLQWEGCGGELFIEKEKVYEVNRLKAPSINEE